MAKLGFMHFSSFSQVTEYLDSFLPASGGPPGLLRQARLDRMRRLLDHLGHPEEAFRSIHVAGSKGKGSTSRFTAALLEAAGERCGLYLSPHLSDYRERFSLAGTFFDDSFLLEAANELYEKVSSFSLPESFVYTKPSTFELYTAYAYILFRNAECSWAVIETGLGGRLDATNTLESPVEIITPVELEHTAVLGNTIREIAVEKSKIIKKDSTVFTGLLCDEAQDVMEKEALTQGARLVSLARRIKSITSDTKQDGEHCSIAFCDGFTASPVLKMKGEVQAQNAALAMLCARELGFWRGEKSLKALEDATLAGRFESHLYKNCNFILDVCHTKASMRHTVSSFCALYPDRQRRCCIFSAIEGKDVKSMLEILMKEFCRIIISRPAEYRKSDSDAIFALACSMNDGSCVIQHIPDAAIALDEAVKSDCNVLVAGSFYLVSLFEEIINAEQQ